MAGGASAAPHPAAPRTMTPSAAGKALVLSTDFSTGYYSGLDLASPWAHNDDIAGTCSDAVARPHGDRVYILGRFGCDFVQVVDGSNLATLNQWSTGNGTNPQDIEVVSPTKAYISLYERNFLLIANPATGAALGSVDLSAFADADGLPETAEMAIVGNRLFVALQRLDRPGGFTAANPSYVVVVDCTTDQIIDTNPNLPGVQPIVLTGRNPFSELVWDPVREKLFVAEAGNFGSLDGGVEYVNPKTLQAEGFFVTEATLGGDLNGVRLWTDCNGYAIVNDANFQTKLVRFDRCTGQSLGICWQSTGYDLCDVEMDYARAQVLVSDRDLLTPGVRIFRAGSSAQLTTSPIDLGLPPCDIAIATPLVPTPATPPEASRLRLLPNAPDPFNPSTTLRVEAAPGTAVRLEIYDVTGRRVRTLWAGVVTGFGRDIVWDGRDDTGTTQSSGVYWARLQAGDAVRTDRLTLVR
jgi:hypothetical protein